jgi:hypothetical protein
VIFPNTFAGMCSHLPPRFLTLFIAIIGLITHARAQYTAPLFELTDPLATGVVFHNTLNEDEERNVLQYQYFYNGGGIAAGDLNNDGLCDLYFCGNDVPDRLYINKGGWRFEDISAKAGIYGKTGWSTGAVMADVNADGYLDIYVCRSGKYDTDARRNQLFINNKNNTFTERAAEFGLDDPAQSTMAAFFDYDVDGDLDMFLLNHSVTQYSNFNVQELRNQRDPMAGNKLYRNDAGKFIDVSAQAGIIGNPINFGLGVAITDFNNDGYPDIFCTNDYQEQDFFYLNNANGTFTQILQYATGHTSLFSMGTDFGDINNDGLSDLFVADMLPATNHRQKMLKGPLKFDAYQLGIEYGFHHQLMRNTLQLNNGNGTFSEIGMMAGVAATDWSWASLFADFDNDGWQDLFVTNGYRRDFTNMDFLKFTYNDELNKAAAQGKEVDMLDLVNKMPSVKIPNYIYKNNQDLTFSDKSTSWGVDQPSFSNGAVYADLDNDGDLDLAVNNLNDTAFLYRNTASKGFLTVEFKGTARNPFGIGCKVTVQGDDLFMVRELYPSRGYQSAMESKLYFGLGAAYLVDVQVEWPGGKKQLFKNVKANSRLIIKEKEAGIDHNGITPIIQKPLLSMLEPTALPAQYVNNSYIDFKREPLLTFSFSDPGPRMAIGDVNGDGRDDVFYTAAKGKQSLLYMQQTGETLTPAAVQPFMEPNPHDMSDAVWIDVDSDQDLDLIAVYGGNETELNAVNYKPVMLLNDGKGVFTQSAVGLPDLHLSASCIRPSDFDQDGDVDLFIGAAILPGKYPLSTSSYLLRNEGGVFIDVTDFLCPVLRNAGMVTDAQWALLDGDALPDLLVTGLWMPVRVFLQTEEGMEEQIHADGMQSASGWFSCLVPGDVDGDGDTDFLAGNTGLNTPFRATENKPLNLFAMDFDHNGTVDPIIAAYQGDTCYPLVGRDDLLDQINPLKKRFVRYEQYADVSVQEIFPKLDWNAVFKLEANNLATCLLINEGDGVFSVDSLPFEAQMFPVRSATFGDVNRDGRTDLIMAGNRLGVRPDVGRMDAGQGLVILQDENGEWQTAPYLVSGLYAPGEITDMKWLTLGMERFLLIAGVGQTVLTYRLNN